MRKLLLENYQETPLLAIGDFLKYLGTVKGQKVSVCIVLDNDRGQVAHARTDLAEAVQDDVEAQHVKGYVRPGGVHIEYATGKKVTVDIIEADASIPGRFYNVIILDEDIGHRAEDYRDNKDSGSEVYATTTPW